MRLLCDLLYRSVVAVSETDGPFSESFRITSLVRGFAGKTHR